VVVEPGEDLACGPVGEQQTAHDVHLPQLHRAAALPAFEPTIAAASGGRIDQLGPLQRSIHPRA